MKPVRPEHFYMTEWAHADERCRARMERMMGGFGVSPDRVRIVSEADLGETIAALHWDELDVRQGRLRFDGDPDVVFNKFRWPDAAQTQEIVDRNPVLQKPGGYTHTFLRMLYGCMEPYHYEDGKRKRDSGVGCWSLYDLHSACGCFHKCQYCRRGRVTTLMLNVEEFVDHVDDLMVRNPWQKVFRYDVETDCLILEPEYGMCRALVEHYATLADRYLILFSKSDNVDFLLDLGHRGHTIMLWTLSTPEVSRLIERDTATTEQRIAAARKCQQAGYTVRFKFKPIIPVANWREQATDMLEQLFAAVRPDNLSMEMLFFDSVAELRELFDVSLFDPDFLALLAQHEASGQMTDHSHPIPEDVRVEVYQHYAAEVKRLSPDTPLALCAETPEAWSRLGPALGMSRDSFVCNCGPVAVPGARARQITTDAAGRALLKGG